MQSERRQKSGSSAEQAAAPRVADAEAEEERALSHKPLRLRAPLAEGDGDGGGDGVAGVGEGDGEFFLGDAEFFAEVGEHVGIGLVGDDGVDFRERGAGAVEDFGDAAAATLIRAEAPGVTGVKMSAFTFGTDGTGAENLIVRNGGLRTRGCPAPGGDHLEMNGGEIFNFTLRVVAALVAEILRRAGLTFAVVDGVVPHQANAYMLEQLREKLGVPVEKFAVTLAECGNTVSSSIPTALRQWRAEPRWFVERRTLLLGFGVGYSWGGCLLG